MDIYLSEVFGEVWALLTSVPVPIGVLLLLLIPGSLIGRLEMLSVHDSRWPGRLARWLLARARLIRIIALGCQLSLVGVLLFLYAYANFRVVERRTAAIGAEVTTLKNAVASLAADLNEERRYRSRSADYFAAKQQEGRKRYVEWWTFCRDSDRAAKAEAEADKWRDVVHQELQRRVSLAEANYFRIAKTYEPFPAGTTAVMCPRGVLLNEHGYRVDRLSDVILRLLRTSRVVVP